MLCVSQHALRPEPTFFVDRSLGRITVPRLLRDAGWQLVTLAEHYGVLRDQNISDVQWIEDATRQGWPLLMKDKRIRYRPAEIRAVIDNKARCFVITRGDLTGAESAARLITQRKAIVTATRRPAPFMYAVHADQLEHMYPPQGTRG